MESLFVPYHAVDVLPGERVLVLAPHPDDEVFGCGGAIMRHVERGAAVTVVILTDGVHGATGADAGSIIAMRRQESRAAALELGYGEPRFLDYPDRGLGYGEPLIADITALCAETGADLVYAPSILEMHPDHRSLGMAALEVLRRHENDALRLAFYEVGIPLRPSHLVDITAVMPRKERAMACFPSQLTRQRYDLDVAALNRYRTYTLPEAVTAAEAFMVFTRADLARDPLGLYVPEYQRQHALGLPLVPADLPLVSVIIRSMDRDVLPRALDSVALQTYSNLEVVLVNATGRQHRDRGTHCGRFPLRMVEPGHALGRSAAANAGLDAARGELLVFLDDDDQFLPHHLASLQRLLGEAGPGVVAAYAGIVCRDDEGREHRRYQRPYDRLWLAIANYIPIHAVLFRKSAVGTEMRFDETLDYCEDWDFWLQLQERGEFRLLPDIGGIYHVAPGTGSGLWGNAALAREAMLKIQRKHLGHWSDEQLWKLFELTQFKPLHDKALVDAAPLRGQVSALEHDLRMSERQRQHLLKQVESIRRERETLRQAIAELHASTSWRVTAPLRRASAAVRGQAAPPDAAAVAAPNSIRVMRGDPHVAAVADGRCRRVDDIDEVVSAWVGDKHHVLLAGNADAGLAGRLRAQGVHHLTAVDADLVALEGVREACHTVVSADLDDPAWPQHLARARTPEGIDAVVAADTLERLRNPWHTLKQLGELAHDGGCIVATFTNASHAAVAGSFAAGHAEYGAAGPLHRARLRFFALAQMDALFGSAGLRIVDAAWEARAPEATPLAAAWNTLPDTTRSALAALPHAGVYRVAVRAVTSADSGMPVILGMLSAQPD